MTAPPPTNAAGRQLTADDPPVTEENFYSCIDAQLAKVESFTLEQVTKLRADITAVETDVKALPDGVSQSRKDKIRAKADEVAHSFLVLEKYVNINFMGELFRFDECAFRSGPIAV